MYLNQPADPTISTSFQGFAAGGQFTATMVFLVEHAKQPRAGLQGSWAFMSVMIGVITGSVVATAFNLALTGTFGALQLWHACITCRHTGMFWGLEQDVPGQSDVSNT